jgi:chloramphenicol-sensitive protein RarD
VVETSLGYFVTPLISVAFGLALFGERLRRAQWLALGLGVLAVVVLTVDYGRLPWIALTLAASFSCYGLVKKRLGLPPTDGLFVESGLLAVPGLGYLGWLAGTGRGTFGHSSGWHTVLLLISGVITAIPLLMFAACANRISMTGLGILQYLAPIIQLFCGVVLLHEPMPPARLAGFALVWLALVIFSWDALRTGRSRPRVPEQGAAVVVAGELDHLDVAGRDGRVAGEDRGVVAVRATDPP